MSDREKFRLNIVGADEDIPRLVLVYGRGCGGEVALVMRPRDGQAALVHQVKKQPAKVWASDPGLVAGATAGGDAPLVPALEVSATDALALVRRLKAGPPAKGPASLRGTWRGALFCTDGKPTMVLERRVASYGTLKVRSDTDGHWHASFERDAKWFSTARQQETPASSTLAEAIQRGMVEMTGLVSEACSFRDTHRRNAVDAEYAVAHPPREPRDPKDPTERYQPRSHYAVTESATGFDVVNEAGIPVARFGRREKGKATKHAAALNRGRTPEGTQPGPSAEPPRPSEPSYEERFAEALRTAAPGNWRPLTELYASPDDEETQKALGAWLDRYARTAEDAQVLLDGRDNAGEAGIRSDAYDEIARRLRFERIVPVTRRPRRGAQVPPPLAEIPAPAPPSSQAETQQAADATVREAESLDNEAQSLWGTSTDAPELVGRAGRLIRHAEALVKAPGCKGRDRQLAWEELKKAAAAYQALREAIERGETPDVETGLRRIAERVSLAAAKAAKSCAGQTTRRTSPVPAEPVAPAKPKRTRRTKAEAESTPTTATEVDPEKDRALMDAFASAIKEAASQIRGAA